MADKVKPRRRYESRRRREQAEQTRRDIITAAGRLFRERGYAVAMPEIAAQAGVVVETVYRTFGSKPGLFRAVIEALLAGGVTRAAVEVEERPAIRAIIDEPNPRRKVELYAATQPGIHRRAGPLLRALSDAKASDPELGRLWDELESWRLDGQGQFVAHLAETAALRSDRSTQEATDAVWTLCSLAVYDLLVVARGWTAERYEAWLAAVLTRELVQA
jgi:TetR/AcrR family transcriptional regulator, regulator of autoinduction and epiphytic fitness